MTYHRRISKLSAQSSKNRGHTNLFHIIIFDDFADTF